MARKPQTTNQPEEGDIMGIEMAAFTVFGMLGLLVAAVRMEEEPTPDVTHQDTRQDDTYPLAA